MNSIGKIISSKKSRSDKILSLDKIMNYRRSHGYRDGLALMPISGNAYAGKSYVAIKRFNKIVRQLSNTSSRSRVFDSAYAKEYVNEIYSHSLCASNIHKYNRFVKSLKRNYK